MEGFHIFYTKNKLFDKVLIETEAILTLLISFWT